jgi:ribosomal-protein-alanine N-acetyltransferase
MRTGKIETKDLELVPYRPVDLLALIEGATEFRSSFGFPAADGLREFLLGPEVAPDYVDMLRSSAKADIWRHGFAIVEKDSKYVVGNVAFVGPPDENGEVEIAYAIALAFEGRGYATQAAAAITDFAFSHKRVKTVRAHTMPEENASTHVLKKNGFKFAGEIEHPQDGLIWRWERTRATEG